jgi:hypothetical protein
MRYLTPYRLAAYVLVVFCALHTAGGMLSQQSLGPDADAVFNAMKSVHFNAMGSTVTWYGFWFGFGLMVSVFLLLSAVIAWQLDRVSTERWSSVSVIAWALAASQLATAVLSWIYFLAGPGVTATLATLLLAFGAFRKQHGLARSPAPARAG